MKFNQINNDRIEIHDSGLWGLITGIVLVVAGIAMAASPLFARDVEWWVWASGAVIIILGIVLCLNVKKRHVVLSRTGGSTITETKLIGGKTISISFTADQVVSVGLDTRIEYTNSSGSATDNSSRPQRQRLSTLYVTLKDTRELEIATARKAGGGLSINGFDMNSFGKAPLAEEAAQVAALFNVPLGSHMAGAMGSGEMVNVARTVFGAPAAQPAPQPTPPQAPVQAVPPATPLPSSPQPSPQQTQPSDQKS